MQEAHVRTGFLPVDLASILTFLFAATVFANAKLGQKNDSLEEQR